MQDIDSIFFSLKSNDGAVLYYLGIRHSRNPQDSLFPAIKGKWNEFLKIAQNPLVVVESREIRLDNADETESIAKGGEVGFMGFLARQSNTPIIGFEPDAKSEADYLLESFSKDRIEYYYFARIVAQWHRLSNRPSVEEYADWHLKRDERTFEWKDFEFTIEHMRAIHQSLFGTVLDLNDLNWFNMIKNPTLENNPLRDVVRASGEYRDKLITENVKNAWIREKKDVFMVYGSGHFEKHQDEFIQASK
jgi:hypothetical protein